MILLNPKQYDGKDLDERLVVPRGQQPATAQVPRLRQVVCALKGAIQ
jgi:hypothetical protein